MRLNYLVPWGELIPRGYAPSYRAPDRDCVVCYPWGLHWLVRWARDLKFWIMYVGYPGFRDRTEFAIEARARKAADGWLETMRARGYRAGWEAAFAAFASADLSPKQKQEATLRAAGMIR